MSETPSLALPLLAAEQAQKHVIHNEALSALDALVQLSVKDRDLTAPPGSPAAGERYIVADGATGAWAGHDGEIAARQNGAWEFYAPREGWLAWVGDENRLLVHDGADWVEAASFVTVLQNLALLGVGTTADATNPFAAKLNKALWTAKTAAEGGDGDLRYTLNKETTADVVSLLFQNGFSGRAELGLIGDDSLTLKVSADGSTWVEAMKVDSTSGFVGLGSSSPVSRLSIEGPLTASSQAKFHFQGTTTAAGGGGFIAHHNNASGALPSSGDRLGYMFFGSTDGATARNGGGIAARAAAAWSSTSIPTYFAFETAPSGSTTRIERLRITETGDLQMGGANTVIDANRHFRLRSYTVATLPSAAPAGQLITVSDGTANKRLAVADGTNWRFPDGAVVS